MLIRGGNPGGRRVMLAGLIAPLIVPFVSLAILIIIDYRGAMEFFAAFPVSDLYEELMGFSVIMLSGAYVLTWLVGIPLCLSLARWNLAGLLPVLIVGLLIGLALLLYFPAYDGLLMFACSLAVSLTGWLIAYKIVI